MKRVSVLLVALLVFACATAQATTFNFSAFMNGVQEVPPNASPACGFGIFVYDDVANALSFNMQFAGLTVPATVGHLHVAPPGVAGPIVFPFANMPNNTFGTFNESWSNLSAQNQSDLFSGRLYANIHNSNFPGGEIRGQVRRDCIPEWPASALAMIPGAIAVLRFRKK